MLKQIIAGASEVSEGAGDLQGLLGDSMPAIQALELTLLEEAVEETWGDLLDTQVLQDGKIAEIAV